MDIPAVQEIVIQKSKNHDKEFILNFVYSQLFNYFVEDELYKIYKYPGSIILPHTPQNPSTPRQDLSTSKNRPGTNQSDSHEILEAKPNKDQVGDPGESGGYNLNGLESNILAKTEQVQSKYEDRGGEEDFDSDIDTFREKKGGDGAEGEGGGSGGKRYKSSDQTPDRKR